MVRISFSFDDDEKLMQLAAFGHNSERLVTPKFAGISRDVVVKYDEKPIHKNLGEVMPAGTPMQLQELKDVCSGKTLLDIGSVLGNVVVHVMLSTAINSVIGIELKADVHRAGLDIM
ncbi:hypothetical protein F443_22025 [Phytophthora nicotianae P1569]|uniref:DOT1 domain-containing protein n=1 Tax=Phytophthora nicotianae P1569 TaxID=1317065 RepID=V9DWA8_PHYNI|nr:hypothetical protein F443_22025 [Phytophthora nicotianae P1569]